MSTPASPATSVPVPFLGPKQGGVLDCSPMESGLMGASVEKRLGSDLVERSREGGLPPLPRLATLLAGGVGGWGPRESPRLIGLAPSAAAAPPDTFSFSIAAKILRSNLDFEVI
jgi:hypothetical protein